MNSQFTKKPLPYFLLAILMMGATTLDSLNAAEVKAKGDKTKAALVSTDQAMPQQDAFQALNRWVATLNPATLSQVEQSATPILLLNQNPLSTKQNPNYIDSPIILGTPDIPFNNGESPTDPTKGWINANYQGVRISVVVLNNLNQVTETRPLSAPFHAGERFKIRILSTFDAISSLDGYQSSPITQGVSSPSNPWLGQIYPTNPDQTVQSNAGEVVSLPLGNNEYFLFDVRSGMDRILLNFRHPKASGNLVNNQPIYRVDNQVGSMYTQLTTTGKLPAFSQQILLQALR